MSERNQMRSEMMHKGVLAIAQIAALMSVLSLGLPMASEAGVFWTEDFENHLNAGGGGPWDTSACTLYFQTPAPAADGCNPMISTDVAHSGTHSLRGYYYIGCPGGDVSGACGTSVSRTHPVVTELYTRIWFRTTGFTYSSVGTKTFYHRDNNGDSPEPYYAHMWGSREQSTIVTAVAEVCPTSTTGATYDTCNYYPNVASVSLNDNQWYCIETHVKMNTPDVPNGAIETWIDGVQTVNYQNRMFRGSAGVNGNISNFAMSLLRIWVGTGNGYMYYDDVAVGDTRIGCGANTPPAPPTGLLVR